MYFKGRDDTNIDDEFENNNILSLFLRFISRYKIIIISIVVLLIMAIIIILSYSGNDFGITNYLVLNGEENVTLYQGSDYIEVGYEAYNSNDIDLSSEVVISSTLNTDKIGEYEIVYTLGKITRIRRVTVIEKPKEYMYIYLNTVDNDVNVYLKLGESYEEPGYQVFSSSGSNINSKVKIEGTVDTSKKGSYKLVYSIVDSNGVTVSATRTVVVMDPEINLTLSTKEYTNKDITINISIVDNYFDYIVLPDGSKKTEKTYQYKVSTNGKYTFTIYNKKGISKESTIEVTNIDKEAPTGSCTLDYKNDGSVISVSANDNFGIKKYVYNNKDYSSSSITLSSYIDSAKVTIYDKAGNAKEVSCKTVALPVISDISNDGVIVTIKAKKVDSDIAGYYFSYTNERPDKDGAYLSTSNESVDVVRLPGTTYVWVQDKSGRISKPVTINLSDSVLLMTYGTSYTILRGTKLSDYLSNKGWSLSEFNKLMARSVRAAGLYTPLGAATAAVSLQTVLAQKYRIKLPYWRGGKTSSMGAYGAWGMYRENPTYEGYNYYGMDCDGFVNWAYKNTGISYSSILASSYYNWTGVEYSKENGEIGDIIKTTGHVALIIGKTDKAFIIAEASGESTGMIVDRYSYSKSGNYTIVKGSMLIERYDKSSEEYPSGF